MLAIGWDEETKAVVIDSRVGIAVAVPTRNARVMVTRRSIMAAGDW
jgi:hypothetical protein